MTDQGDQTVDLTPGSEDIATASLRTKITGNQRWMAKAMAEMADQLVKMAEALEALELDVETSRTAAYRAGQEIAARAIQRHADEFAPSGGNIQQRRMRRHLLIAARVARPTPTVEEIADAVRRGDYAACYLDEDGKPVSEKG